MATFVSNVTPTAANDPAAESTAKFISQINVGNSLYDIATHHGIKFHNGSSDTNGTSWNGITDLDVIIPSIADLVTDPIKLVGIVGSDGKVTSGTSEVSTFKAGDLVFISKNCTFGGKTCEAGDMAVYDGSIWYIVSGENQIEIYGIGTDAAKTFKLTGTAASVLTVEGKTLSLAIDYSDVNSHVIVSTNTSASWPVTGNVAVDSMYVTLSKGTDTSKDISTIVSLDIPTTLTSGLVTMSKVFASTDFSFDQGTLPSVSLNSTGIAVTASTNISLSKKTGNDFLTGVDGALKSVAFATGTSEDGKSVPFATVGTISGTQSFVSGIHAASTDDEKADTAPGVAFVNYGAATLSNNTVVSGLSAATATAGSDSLVSSITIGNVSLGDGSDILTGISSASNASGAIVTGVSFGTISSTSTKSWFLSGWGSTESSTSYDFVTSITVGAVTFASSNTTSFKKSGVSNASVSEHVLVISTGDFMAPVELNQADSYVSGKTFTKGGVENTTTGVSTANFTSKTIAQPTVSVSYKNILTNTVSIAQNKTNYFLDKKAETVPSVTYTYKYLNTEAATFTSTALDLINKEITATLPSQKVVVGISAGTLPSLAISGPSREIFGTVSTALTTSKKEFLAIDSTKKEFSIPGDYTLVTTATSENAVTVAKAGTYELADGNVVVAASTFVTNVSISK